MIVLWRRRLRGHKERTYLARLRRAGELMATLWAAVAKARTA